MDAPDALARIVIVVGDDDRRVEVEPGLEEIELHETKNCSVLYRGE